MGENCGPFVLYERADAIATVLVSRRRLGARIQGMLLALLCLLATGPELARAEGTSSGKHGAAKILVRIPAGDAQDTLPLFAEQTGRQMLYRADAVRGIPTRAVAGRFTPDAALQLLLRDTALASATTDRGVITVVRKNDNNEKGRTMHIKQARTSWLNRLVAGMASAMVSGGIAAAETPRDRMVLEEVIVTAQKRTQTLRDVAMTVNVISGRDFEDNISFDFADIDRLVAGLDVRGDSFDTNIVLRGVGTDLSAPVSPRVTAYLDGAHISALSGLFVAQYDLAQFEVLRGSQGSLYGKASPAGAITVRTQSPSLDSYHGQIRQSVFSRDGRNTQLALGAPLIDGVLGVRIAGVYDQNRNADINNRFLEDDASKRTASGRISLLYQPWEAFSSRLSYQYTDYTQDYFEVLSGNGPLGEFNYRDRQAAGNVPGVVDIREKHLIWENNLDLGERHQLTAVSFYQEQQTVRLDDRDITSAEVDRQLLDSNYAGDWNQEVRLSSLGNARWDYIAGVYYADSDARTAVDRVRHGGAQVLDIDIEVRSEDLGLFTHNIIHLNEATALTAGLRWTREERFASTRLLVRIPSRGLVIELPADDPDNRLRTFRAWTGTLKLQHDWHDDVMSYVSYDRAFRAGSNNISSGFFPRQFVLFDEETSHSFELGVKSRFMDGAGEVSAALYYQIYDDFQFQADNIPLCETVGAESCDDVGDFSAVVPAEEVVAKGFEVETRMLLGEHFSMFTALSYNETTFESYPDAPCDTGSVPNQLQGFATCDFAGRDIGVAPTWTAVLSGEYTRPLQQLAGSEWYLRGLLNVNDGVADPSGAQDLSGYGIVDMFTGVRSASGLWDVSVWARNLLDKDAVIASSFVSAFPDNYRAVRVTDPRMVGMTASYRW